MTVNGKVYDWADVDFKIPGLDIEVQEISYDDELDQEAVYGRGNKPRGFGTGNYSSTGKISLLRDDYHKLLAYCKAKGVSFFKLQFPSVVVSYAMTKVSVSIGKTKDEDALGFPKNKVNHPAVPSHPDHELYKKLFPNGGGSIFRCV